MAEKPGPQTVRLIFHEPQHIRRIHLAVREQAVERTQELVLRWSTHPDATMSQVIVRQQWNFSPTGSTEEVEDYTVDLPGLRVLEVTITPNISGGPGCAAIAELRLV